MIVISSPFQLLSLVNVTAGWTALSLFFSAISCTRSTHCACGNRSVVIASDIWSLDMLVLLPTGCHVSWESCHSSPLTASPTLPCRCCRRFFNRLLTTLRVLAPDLWPTKDRAKQAVCDVIHAGACVTLHLRWRRYGGQYVTQSASYTCQSRDLVRGNFTLTVNDTHNRAPSLSLLRGRRPSLPWFLRQSQYLILVTNDNTMWVIISTATGPQDYLTCHGDIRVQTRLRGVGGMNGLSKIRMICSADYLQASHHQLDIIPKHLVWGFFPMKMSTSFSRNEVMLKINRWSNSSKWKMY